MPKVKKTNKKKSSNVVPLKRDLVQSENTENSNSDFLCDYFCLFWERCEKSYGECT